MSIRIRPLCACLLMAGVFSGCQVYFPYRAPRMLSDLPPRPEVKQVEMYYPGDLLPQRDYIPVAIIEVKKRGKINSQYLAETLRQEGMETGVDAIIDIRKENFTWERMAAVGQLTRFVTSLDEDSNNDYQPALGRVYHSFMSGIGVIYTDSIDYLDQFVRQQNLYRLDPDDPGAETFAGSIHYDAHGRASRWTATDPEMKAWHDKYLYPYSLDHLVSEKENWRYSPDETGRTLRRRLYRFDDWLVKTCKLRYAGPLLRPSETLQSIRIRYPDKASETVYLYYDEAKKLNRKRIVGNDKTVWEETLSYAADGRLSESRWHRIENDREVPFLVARYEYYTPDDKEKLLGEEAP